jgi:peptidoglycan/xylan/chitin deacetylase (PgdA/CDA1 family)
MHEIRSRLASGELGAEYVLEERYTENGGGRSALLRPYYALKPLLPRSLQLAVRRVYARRQAKRTFPRWPVEDLLVRLQEDRFRERIRAAGGDPVPFVNFWPEARRFAFVLTHDVEDTPGVENIPRVREVERRNGMVSSWNFVAEDYPIPDGLFAQLREEGCEIGLHGIHHDGKLFRDEKSFERMLPRIHQYLEQWDAVGFRSPATHRNPDWMPRLGSLYDSSFPDTDPFEPQSGGCCSIFPYFIEDLVELPITLVQDHTMWDILRQPGIGLWLEKASWIRDHHGLVNVIVHPDYLLTPERLDLYDRFLRGLAHFGDGWHALPRDVAEWWKARAAMAVDDGQTVTGADGWAASIARAREDGDRVVYDV